MSAAQVDLSLTTFERQQLADAQLVTDAARLVSLTAAVGTAGAKSEAGTIEDGEDAVLSLQQAREEIHALKRDAAVRDIEHEKAVATARYVAETTWQRTEGGGFRQPLPVDNSKLVYDRATIEKEVGFETWKSWSPVQQAKAMTLRQSAVDKADLTPLFGKLATTKTQMASATENPALHRLLRQRALDERVY